MASVRPRPELWSPDSRCPAYLDTIELVPDIGNAVRTLSRSWLAPFQQRIGADDLAHAPSADLHRHEGAAFRIEGLTR